MGELTNFCLLNGIEHVLFLEGARNDFVSAEGDLVDALATYRKICDELGYANALVEEESKATSAIQKYIFENLG